jgi:hypothetical protein
MEDEIGGTCGMNRGDEKRAQNFRTEGKDKRETVSVG